MPHRPVPPVVDGQPLEQRLVALEQLLAGVQEQALAEAPRARQEVVLALVEQPPDIGGLVDVVAVPLPDLVESLHADGQLASSHGIRTRIVVASVHFRICRLRPRGGRTRSLRRQPTAPVEGPPAARSKPPRSGQSSDPRPERQSSTAYRTPRTRPPDRTPLNRNPTICGDSGTTRSSAAGIVAARSVRIARATPSFTNRNGPSPRPPDSSCCGGR